MEEAEEPLVYAKVRFIADGYRENIPIVDIVEYNEHPPKHRQDCDIQHIYTCWYKNEKNPELSKYGIQIAGFITEKEGLNNKRMTFPYPDDTLIDRYYEIDSSEEERVDKKNENKKKKKQLTKKIKDKVLKEQKSILQTKMQKMKGSNFLQLKEKSEKNDITSHGHAPFIEPEVKPIESKKEETKNETDKPKERKRLRSISTSSESDIENADKWKSVEKSQARKESKASNNNMREMKGTGRSDKQMNTGKSKNADENQAYFPIDDSRMDSNGNTLPVQSEVLEVQKTAGTQDKQDIQDTEEHNNLSDTVTESYEVTKLKKLNEILADDFTNLKKKFRQLQEKYNKQTERLETLQYLNEKLQTQLYIPSTGKDKLIKLSPIPKIASQIKNDSPIEPNCVGTSTPKSTRQSRLLSYKQPHLTVSPITIRKTNEDKEERELNLSQCNFFNEIEDDIPENKSEYSPSNAGSDPEEDKVTEPAETDPQKLTQNRKARKRQISYSSESDDEENAKRMKKDEIEEKSKNDKEHKKSNSKGLKKAEMEETSKSGKKFRDKFTDPHGMGMMYIKHDLVVPYKSWQNWILKSESLFAKKLLNYFYSKEELTRRCVLEGDSVLTPHRTQKRKQISPKKSDAIERSLRYHCYKHKIKDEQEINKRLAKKNGYFTEEINKYLKAARANLKKDNDK